LQKENWEKINAGEQDQQKREELWRKNKEYQEKIIH